MKNIRDFNLYNKKVIIRVDFNVPIKDNVILDDNRIKESLKTINFAIESGAKVILMSHLGRIKTEEDKLNNSLDVVSLHLSDLLNKSVKFIPYTRGKILEDAINNLEIGQVLLMENTRFEDLDGNLESGCDVNLSKYWASLGDIFINDAFATLHRAHSSNVGIAKFLDSGIGFLIEKELNCLSKLSDPVRPYTIIMGGAKVKDKIKLIENLIDKCDNILIGGAMAYTFLYALGYNVGSSIVDLDSIDFCKNILSKYKNKIILPIDSVVSNSVDGVCYNKNNDEFIKTDIGYDIGKNTINKFINVLKDSKTIMWNGPLGYFEEDKYSNGTKNILKYLSKSNKTVIIGGGDTASAAINFGFKDSFTHISTGGGATLEYLEGSVLPGLEIIGD